MGGQTGGSGDEGCGGRGRGEGWGLETSLVRLKERKSYSLWSCGFLAPVWQLGIELAETKGPTVWWHVLLRVLELS